MIAASQKQDRERKTIEAITRTPPPPDEILSVVLSSLDGDKAEDVTVIDLVGKTSIADFMIIATGNSQRQIGAMTDHILRRLKNLGVRSVTTEGTPVCDWVLVDAGDVVVHVFRPEVRSFYALERLWGASNAPASPQAAPTLGH